jgi:ATP-dependent DNA helicase RecG
VLELLHLGRRKNGEFIPNVACALVFANDPLPLVPGCKIRAYRFDGNVEWSGERYNAVKEERFEGPVPVQIAKASDWIESQVRRFSGLGKDQKFGVSPEYPRSAWHEALVNACVHRSYTFRNMNIFIKLFDDRIEFDSPGGFMPGVTPANIYDRQHARNPFLIEALFYLGLTKAGNEGVKRMRETMLALELPEPSFRQTDTDGTKVKVVLSNNIQFRRVWVDADVAHLIGAKIAAALTESEKIIINYMAVEGSISVSQASRRTEHNWPTSKKVLDGLVSKGLLRYIRRQGVEVDRQATYELAIQLGSQAKQ